MIFILDELDNSDNLEVPWKAQQHFIYVLCDGFWIFYEFQTKNS